MMKRAILEATDENILNTISNNNYGRNNDVKDFIKALDLIDGNMFISLDAKWGEGKTFYVRQIEKTLEFILKRARAWEEESRMVDKMESYFENTCLNTIDLQKSYLPIYYNAWLYDNHDDPLMSLIFIIVKKSEQFIETKRDSSLVNKIIDLLSSASISIGNIPISFEGEKIKNSFVGTDILDKVKTAEEIRELVKEILDNVITETAEKLIIFIDELDRCKPSYAIEMLERIKHYFDDERIIFVVSVNKEQLVHTITKYYGQGFDATGYLNKFFDLNIHMPEIENGRSSLFKGGSSRQIRLREIANGLSDYYKLSLRDALIFNDRISNLPPEIVNDYTTQGCYLSLFIPIIEILTIKDEEEKNRFLNGESGIIQKFSENVNIIYEIVCQYGENSIDNGYESGLEVIKRAYEYIFGNIKDEPYSGWGLEIDSEMKKICVKLCNGFY